MDLTVAIVSWNTRDLLEQCLESIYATTNGIDFEVVVVDNASSDGTVAAVQKSFPRAVCIANTENVGFASANNQAYRATGSRYFMLLNPDTVVHSGLQGSVRFLDDHPDAAVVGCKSLNPDGSVQISWNFHYPGLFYDWLPTCLYNGLRGFRASRTVDSTVPVAWVGGVCMTVRRRAVDSVGLLDEDYYIYTEEADWCRRFSRAGWKVMHSPEVLITHYGGQSTSQVAGQMRLQLARSKLRFVRKHRSHCETWMYLRAGLFSHWTRRALMETAAVLGKRTSADEVEIQRKLAEVYRGTADAIH